MGAKPDPRRSTGAETAAVLSPAPAAEPRGRTRAPRDDAAPVTARPRTARSRPAVTLAGPEARAGAGSAARQIEPDRFASLASLVEMHVRRGDLEDAQGVLARMRAQVGEGPQAAKLDALAASAETARAAAEEAVLVHLEQGEVLAADLVAERLGAAGRWAPACARLQALGLGEDWLRAAAAEEVDRLPDAAQLARHREVRLQWQDGWQTGSVAGARGDRTTVRLIQGQGQRFPTVATVAVEPVDTDASEAAALAVVAARAGAPRLARLWLARACLLEGAPDALVRQLRRALR